MSKTVFDSLLREVFCFDRGVDTKGKSTKELWDSFDEILRRPSKSEEEARREHSDMFVAEYQIRKRLESVEDPDMDRDFSTSDDDKARAECLRLVDDFDPDIKKGQIRMMSPEFGIGEPRRVVVLGKWMSAGENGEKHDDDMFVVAPLSRFNNPATGQEIQILDEKDGACFVRVVQIWLIHSLSRKTLERSWVSGEIGARALKEACSFANDYMGLGNEKFDEILRLSTGLPRREHEGVIKSYMDEEYKRWSNLFVKDHAKFLD